MGTTAVTSSFLFCSGLDFMSCGGGVFTTSFEAGELLLCCLTTVVFVFAVFGCSDLGAGFLFSVDCLADISLPAD